MSESKGIFPVRGAAFTFSEMLTSAKTGKPWRAKCKDFILMVSMDGRDFRVNDDELTVTRIGNSPFVMITISDDYMDAKTIVYHCQSEHDRRIAVSFGMISTMEMAL